MLVAGAIFRRIGRRWSWEGLGLGVLGWWLAATVATSLGSPGMSYAFAWPLLAILAGQAVAFRVPRGGRAAVLASWLGALPFLIIHMMILPGLFDGLNLRLTALLMVPVVLAAGRWCRWPPRSWAPGRGRREGSREVQSFRVMNPASTHSPQSECRPSPPSVSTR